MKKVYFKPTSEIVVLNLGEPVAWGELANASNTGDYTEAKEGSFEEEDTALDRIKSIEFPDLWEEDEEE